MPDMLPIIRQMHDAKDNQERASILLACPDVILVKFAGVLDGVCQRSAFDAGSNFILMRLATMRAVRGADGLLHPDLAYDFEKCRVIFAACAASNGVKKDE